MMMNKAGRFGLIWAAIALQPAIIQAQDGPVNLTVVSAELASDHHTGDTVLDLKLAPQSTAEFARLTTENVGRKMALSIHGQILTRPTIQSPITSGEIRISPGLDPGQPDLATLAERLQSAETVVSVEVLPREEKTAEGGEPSANIPST